MARFILDERARLVIALWLTANADNPDLHQRQEAEARRLGLSGAEIDAARSGRSFDAQISAVLALAAAEGLERPGLCEHARRLGIDDIARAEIDAYMSGLARDGS